MLMPRIRLPGVKNTPLRLATEAARKREWELAARYYREVLDRKPDNPPIWVQYGHALKESGHVQEAENAYRKSLEMDPDTADTHLQLGHALKIQGNKNEAAASYLRALALDPTLHVLVIDDNSPDGTGRIADDLAVESRRVHVVHRQMKQGLGTAYAAGFAYGHHRFIGGWSGELRFPPYDPLRLLDRHLIGATALTRREVIEQTGGFDPGFTAFEDWEFWVNALAHGWRGVRVDAVTLEYRRHGETKLQADRRRYRAARRRLRAKHAALYARRAELAAESDLGTAGRLTYRWFWGVRPVPAALEAAVHRTMWAAGGPR